MLFLTRLHHVTIMMSCNYILCLTNTHCFNCWKCQLKANLNFCFFKDIYFIQYVNSKISHFSQQPVRAFQFQTFYKLIHSFLHSSPKFWLSNLKLYSTSFHSNILLYTIFSTPFHSFFFLFLSHFSHLYFIIFYLSLFLIFNSFSFMQEDFIFY